MHRFRVNISLRDQLISRSPATVLSYVSLSTFLKALCKARVHPASLSIRSRSPGGGDGGGEERKERENASSGASRRDTQSHRGERSRKLTRLQMVDSQQHTSMFSDLPAMFGTADVGSSSGLPLQDPLLSLDLAKFLYLCTGNIQLFFNLIEHRDVYLAIIFYSVFSKKGNVMSAML